MIKIFNSHWIIRNYKNKYIFHKSYLDKNKSQYLFKEIYHHKINIKTMVKYHFKIMILYIRLRIKGQLTPSVKVAKAGKKIMNQKWKI